LADTTNRLLRRLLDEPGHIVAVRSLEAGHFGALVRSVGLEDAGELLAMATPAQMLAVLDEAVWRADEGSVDERLDPERFSVWLEVLLEGGDALAAQRLAELPEELLTAALCAQLFVLDLDALGHGMAGASWEEAALAERVLDEALYLELDRYTLLAKHGLGWDPTIAALLALDRTSHELVQRVLERCHVATLEELEREGDGLYTVLRAQETIEADALADREDRRSRKGYVSRASATSFLALAEQTALDDAAALAEDPITRAYFRELAADPAPLPAARGSSSGDPSSRRLDELVAHLGALDGVVSQAPVLPEAAGDDADEPACVAALRHAMAELLARDPERHADQIARLAYLANVLMTAGKPDGDPYGVLEASRHALLCCARGLEHLHTTGESSREACLLLQRIGADGLFRIGWRLSRQSRSG